MASIALAKVHLSRLMMTSIFGIWASEPGKAWQKTQKVGLIGLTKGQKSFCSVPKYLSY